MKNTFSITLASIALSTLAAADMSMTSCTVSHNSGNGGNQFVISWAGVPSSSEPRICGSFQTNIKSQASSNKMELKGLSCATSGAVMSTVVTLNKQACSSQADAIVRSMQNAVGSGGGLSGGNVCSFDKC